MTEVKHKGLSDEELAVKTCQIVKKYHQLMENPKYQPTDKDLDNKIKGEG